MSKDSIRYTPCSRCNQDSKTLYTTSCGMDGGRYCSDCLVPFTCGVCGETRHTIPENIQPGEPLACQYCADGQQGDGWGIFDFWWWAEGITGVFALISGFYLLALLVSGLRAAAQFEQFHLATGTWVVAIAMWAVALFLLFRLTSALWNWKPHSTK